MYKQYFTKFDEILFTFHHFLVKWCKIWHVLEHAFDAEFTFHANMAGVGVALIILNINLIWLDKINKLVKLSHIHTITYNIIVYELYCTLD